MIRKTQIASEKRPSGSKIDQFRNPPTGLRNVQQQVLSEVLRRNSKSRYGQVHQFEQITDTDEYRRLPFMTYDRVEGVDAYWDEAANFTSDRLIAYFLTSGSSSTPKRIPVTSSLVREKAKAFGLFWEAIYTAHPKLKNGYFIANFADSGSSTRNSDGILEIAETTFWNQRMQGFQDSSRWPAGKYLTAIKSAELRYYAAARLALQSPLHCMMSLNPSTLVKFCHVIEAHSTDLARGMQDGLWGLAELDSKMDLPAELTNALQKNAEAAGKLTTACESRGVFFQLRDIWPDLELVICWQSDLVEPYLRLLRQYTEGVSYRDYITQSSECVIAVPVADDVSGGLLAYSSHFFEFIPEDQVDKVSPQTVPAWEVEVGRKYEVVVTTGGGLYRYRTGDCVAVNGFDGEIPQIGFQYRLGRTSSITGEKLTEQQVLTALREARSPNIEVSNIVVFPRTGAQSHYAVMLPRTAVDGGDLENVLANWLSVFDRELGRANGEYKDKRESLRLGGPCVLLIGEAEFDSFQSKNRAAHVGDDQYKPGVLRKDRDLERGIGATEEYRANR